MLYKSNHNVYELLKSNKTHFSSKLTYNTNNKMIINDRLLAIWRCRKVILVTYLRYLTTPSLRKSQF